MDTEKGTHQYPTASLVASAPEAPVNSGYGTQGQTVHMQMNNPNVNVEKPPHQQPVVVIQQSDDGPESDGCVGGSLTLGGFVKDFLYLSGVTINAVVGWIFLFVTLVLGVSTMPLCCVGIVFFRVAFYLVGVFGRIDMFLHNFAALHSETIHVPGDEITSIGNVFVISNRGYLLSRSLGDFSIRSFLAILYFISVYPIIGFISALFSCVGIIVSVAFIGVSLKWILTGERVCLTMINWHCEHYASEGDEMKLLGLGIVGLLATIFFARIISRVLMMITRTIVAKHHSASVYVSRDVPQMYERI